MALCHKWDVKNDFAYVLQFFPLISDGLGSVYVLFYPYSIFRRRSTSNVIENKKQEIVLKPSPLPYKPEFRKQATLTLITVDENASRLINFNKLRDSPPPYEELEDISDSVSIPMPAATIGMCTKIAFALY